MKCVWPGCEVSVGDRRKRCEEHAYEHHKQDTAWKRKLAQDEIVWTPKECFDCGVTFDPKESRIEGVGGPPRKRCPACHGYKPKTRPCKRCTAIIHGGKSPYCDDCRPIALAETKLRTAEAQRQRQAEARALKPDCSICGTAKAAYGVTTCAPCGRAARKRQQSRLRNFKDRLFQSLVYEPEDVEFILGLLDSPCVYCGRTEGITIEHLTPLIRGGAHDKSNLAPACKSCNSKKGTMTHEEFQISSKQDVEIENRHTTGLDPSNPV